MKKLNISKEEMKKRKYEQKRKCELNNLDKVNNAKKEWIKRNVLKDKKCHQNYIKKNHEELKEKWRKQRLNNLDYHNKKQKEYYSKNKIKVKAQSLANKNVMLNDNCDICNSMGKLERHHWNYNKPLLVNTLCKTCHEIQHIKHFEDSVYGGEQY